MEWHIEAWTKRRSGVADRVLAGQTIGTAAAEAVDLHSFAELITKAISATPPEGAGRDYVPRLKEFLGVLQASIREGSQTIRPDLCAAARYGG